MQLSETTNQSGLVQRVEFLTRLPYGSTDDQLRTIINLLNNSFEKVMPLLLSYSDYLRWDDTNNTDKPVAKTNIVSGLSDYKITEDDNSLDVLNITSVWALESASGTEFKKLQRLYPNDENYEKAISPNPSVSGIPTHFAEVGSFTYLYPEPNYSATNGLKLFFEREQTYFTVTGTSGADTTEPGIPKPFHDLLAHYAASDYVMVNRPDDVRTLNLLENRISDMKQNLFDLISLRNPTKVGIIPATQDNR